MSERSCTQLPALPARLLAAGAAALVLLLTLLAASPDLHASLHALDCHGCATPNGSDADHPDASCAVSLFAKGAETLDLPEQLTGILSCLQDSITPADLALPEEAARLHHPSRGPPRLS